MSGTAQIKWSENCNINTTRIQNSNNRDNSKVTDNNNSKLNYFLPGTQQEGDKKACAEITKKLYKRVY